MRIFKFLRKNLINCIVVLLAVVAFSSVAAFCWLADSSSDSIKTDFKSSTAAAYFAGGDGSSENPYQISAPVHLYNFAWLQYLGYFNLRKDFNNGRAQSYFTLTADVNMKGFVLPPIGNTEYPFIGNFNGDGYAITELTVSNGFADFNGKIYPVGNANFSSGGVLYTSNTKNSSSGTGTGTGTGTTTSGVSVSYLGFFGVTGNYNKFVTSSYTTTVHSFTDKLEDGVVPAKNEFYMSEMSVEGFYLDYEKVNSHNSSALVGLVAGGVYGDVKNAGVYQSSIEFVNAATRTPQSSSDNVVSKYGLIGYYDTSTVSTRKDTVPGKGGAWGGSIDMKMINRRLNYMFTEGSISSTTSKSKTYKVNMKVNTIEYYWRKIDGETNVGYLYDDTIIPLNVDESAMYLDEETENSDYDKTTTKGTNTLHTNAFYEKGEAEIVSSQNTGYIVGSTSQSPRVRINGLTGITRSLGNQTTSFNGDNLTFLTTSVDGGTQYRIESGATNIDSSVKALTSVSPSKFTYYDSVRENFINTMTGENYIHGFHFMNAISVSNVPTTDDNVDVMINGVADSYKLVKGGLNFSIKENNMLRLVVGTYFNSQANHALFDLYKITRFDNGDIETITKINKIYEYNDTIYYNTPPVSGLDPVFDFQALNKSGALTIKKAAYYFEIPILKGDYVIGADANDTISYTAYLMYLDIGANGDDGTSDGKYSVSMVDFVNYCDTDKLKNYIATYNQYPQFDDIYAQISEATAGSYVYFRRQSNSTSTTFPQSSSLLGYVFNGLTINFTQGSGEVDDEAKTAWTSG